MYPGRVWSSLHVAAHCQSNPWLVSGGYAPVPIPFVHVVPPSVDRYQKLSRVLYVPDPLFPCRCAANTNEPSDSSRNPLDTGATPPTGASYVFASVYGSASWFPYACHVAPPSVDS